MYVILRREGIRWRVYPGHEPFLTELAARVAARRLFPRGTEGHRWKVIFRATEES